MDRTETLAGLAEALAGHGMGRIDVRTVTCKCGEVLISRQRGTLFEAKRTPSESLNSHQAAVVLAHLEAHGWAQGREEWGVMHHGYGNTFHIQPAKDRAEAEAEAFRLYDVGHTAPSAARRRVSEWEPVEDADG